MNEQLKLVQEMENNLEIAYFSLAEEMSIDEDEALDILRNSPSFMQHLRSSSRKAEKFSRIASLKKPLKPKKKTVRKKNKVRGVTFDDPDPYEYHPDHPKYTPGVTTKSVYNAQMGQNMSPIIHNLAKRIAQDRNLEEPNYRVLEAQMKKLDWSYLAYEATYLGPKPPKHKLLRVMSKLFKPIDTLAEKVPIKYLILILTVVQVLYIVWATFYQYSEGMATQAARGVAHMHNRKVSLAQKKYLKKLRY